MWGKIAGIAKKVGLFKASRQASENSEITGIFSAVGKAPIFIGIGLFAVVALLLVAPLFILSSSPTTYILQALDDSKKEEDDGCGSSKNIETVCANPDGVTKVLFVGNSRTYAPGSETNYNGIPKRFEYIAEAAGYDVEVTTALKAATTLSGLSSLFDSDIQQSYDCVVMQEQTETYLNNYNVFKAGAQSVVDKVRQANPNVKTYVRNTWAYNTFNEDDFQKGYDNGNKVAQETGSYVIEDGKAFQLVHKNDPDLKLMSDDRHQNRKGAYLSAATIFKTLFGKSVDGISYDDGIHEDELSVLQKAADETVSTLNNNTCGGPILLIAGHSYEPYCNNATNECRPTAASGYTEPDETRSLVKLIKSELLSLGIETDIANELLAPGDSKMNKSFYVELVNNTETFNKINWNKYKFALEVHFNAAGNGALQTDQSGPLLVKTDGSYKTAADDDIIKAITSNLNTSQQKDSVQFINSINYFQKANIPITYLETEFFDNKQAMDNYTSKKNQIAKDIAAAIKSAYGTAASGSRADIVKRAREEMGKDYVWGATGPDSYDCSGLVGYALTGTHERLGTTYTFMEWPEAKDPKPGDIAVNYQHTGIYIGDGKMIHASAPGIGVIEGPVQEGMKIVTWPDLKDK